jgi:hypothetical protein
MRFALNRRGVDDLVESVQVRVELERQAGDVVRTVEREAEGFARTRHFAKSITKNSPERTARGTRITVFSTDHDAHLIEFGSANNPPYSPFRKAASRLGLRLRGGGERR